MAPARRAAFRPDAHGLGIDVDAQGRVITRDGRPVDSLHCPRPGGARDREATAVHRVARG
jgi:hypothetical protein